jgi:CelD/BcsL family acetyltransferase involved in cellulose biosynthesis
MDIYVIKPLEDPRWADLINQHPKASVFHTTAWLGALSRTYGYKPVAFTTSSPDGALGNGLVACDVCSWLTGHRLVSLPFSDYCEPLFDSPDELQCVIRYLQDAVSQGKWSYVEFRPVSKVFGEAHRDDCFQSNGQYLLHRLDLRPQTEELFQNLDKDSVQRRIRRAERAGLTEECGRSEDLLRKFYALLIITRRRHHLPPQPYAWFRNLVNSFGDALEIRTIVKEQIPVASILTLRFKDTVYYKYGCSDARYNNLGATPLLLWRAIVAAKSTKAQIFDFGRTETDNSGLISFKDKWAPRSNPLVYLRFPHRALQGEARNLRVVKQIFARMPEKLLAIAGSLIYRHIG